jgi:hypothetical protein
VPPSGCADSFTYVLRVDSLTTTMYDCGEDDLPATAAVVAYLSQTTSM